MSGMRALDASSLLCAHREPFASNITASPSLSHVGQLITCVSSCVLGFNGGSKGGRRVLIAAVPDGRSIRGPRNLLRVSGEPSCAEAVADIVSATKSAPRRSTLTRIWSFSCLSVDRSRLLRSRARLPRVAVA
jgi:hypothetical protein